MTTIAPNAARVRLSSCCHRVGSIFSILLPGLLASWDRPAPVGPTASGEHPIFWAPAAASAQQVMLHREKWRRGPSRPSDLCVNVLDGAALPLRPGAKFLGN